MKTENELVILSACLAGGSRFYALLLTAFKKP
jgi:hypothetical protein